MVADNPIRYLVPPELRALVAGMNDTARDVSPAPLHELALEALRARPDAVALTAPGIVMTARALERATGEVAAALRDAGAGSGTVVGVCLEFGWQQAPAMLGTLAAGAAFHALPPEASALVRAERLAAVGGTVVLTQPWLDERIAWPAGTTRVLLDTSAAGEPAVAGVRGEPAVAGVPGEPSEPGGDAAACVLEGAGGELVTLTHAALANSFGDVVERFGGGQGDRVLALSPATSPLALFDTLGVLAAGGGLVLPADIDLRQPARWLDELRANRVTIWDATPALTAMLTGHLLETGGTLPETLRLVLVSGEPLGLPLARALRSLAGPSVTTVNLAGRPASGIWSLCMPFEDLAESWKHVPGGRPLGNQRVYVLGDDLAPCPVWVAGRVYYGGSSLAAAVTLPGGGDAFTTHPETGERLYRSPDRGRLLDDGTVELLGDDTSQVLVHGQALDARDAEVALMRHDAVATAVVAPVANGELAAWVQPRRGEGTTAGELGEFLRRKLSPYLLPSVIEVVEALPLTPGGVVDRAALAASAGGAPGAVAAGAPAPARPPAGGATSARVRALAVDVLGIERMEADTNLVDLGATSVDLVRLATRVEQELGVPIDVTEMLRFPSLAVVESLVAAGAERGAADRASAPAGDVILDPVEREAFKDAGPAIRRDLDAGGEIRIQAPAQLARATARRTHRRFAVDPVAFPALAAVLGGLRAFASGGRRKYWYPSAGGAYAVQTYLSVKDGRVDALGAGTYYYEPVRNLLVPVAPGRPVPDDAHVWINRDAAEQAAFTIYLVLDRAAMAPLYGDRSDDYGLIEAGAMAQLLSTLAAEEGLGLCAIGEMRDAPLAGLLRLGEHHRLLHSLLGGVPDPGGDAAYGAQAGMLDRLDEALPASDRRREAG
jgi:nonribosomal peptide synthetase protein BlmIII